MKLDLFEATCSFTNFLNIFSLSSFFYIASVKIRTVNLVDLSRGFNHCAKAAQPLSFETAEKPFRGNMKFQFFFQKSFFSKF